MKVLIIIPAYNEEKNIEQVVHTLTTEYPQYDYIVINDGSTDQTAEICRQNHFHTINLPINLGLAGAFQTGMLYAYHHGSYDYTLQYDGDGQHRPEYIDAMLQAAQDNLWDITIASRYLEKDHPKTPVFKAIGMSIIKIGILLTTGKKITDPTSGMRLYNKKMIDLFALRMNFNPEPDAIAFLLRCGVKIGEIPVKMNERTGGKSYLNPLTSIKYMFIMCSSILLIQWFRKNPYK